MYQVGGDGRKMFAKDELEGSGQKATNLDMSSMYQEEWKKDTSEHPKKWWEYEKVPKKTCLLIA